MNAIWLRQKLLDAPGPEGFTLRQVLEDPQIPLLFFSVSNDSDAIYHRFNILMGGVIDVQLMSLAISGPNDRLPSLAK